MHGKSVPKAIRGRSRNGDGRRNPTLDLDALATPDMHLESFSFTLQLQYRQRRAEGNRHSETTLMVLPNHGKRHLNNYHAELPLRDLDIVGLFRPAC